TFCMDSRPLQSSDSRNNESAKQQRVRRSNCKDNCRAGSALILCARGIELSPTNHSPDPDTNSHIDPGAKHAPRFEISNVYSIDSVSGGSLKSICVHELCARQPRSTTPK